MNKEIERKFRVIAEDFIKEAYKVFEIKQGYFSKINKGSMRVRIRDKQAFLTIKSPISMLSKNEFEYEIPLEDAQKILSTFCEERVITKKRYLVNFANKLWEVDYFTGRHQGLIIAEIELDSEDETFEKPQWVEEELTGNVKYYNSYLASH